MLICNDEVETKLSFLLKMVDFSGKGLINMWELEMLMRACGRSYAKCKDIEEPPEDWYRETLKAAFIDEGVQLTPKNDAKVQVLAHWLAGDPALSPLIDTSGENYGFLNIEKLREVQEELLCELAEVEAELESRGAEAYRIDPGEAGGEAWEKSNLFMVGLDYMKRLVFKEWRSSFNGMCREVEERCKAYSKAASRIEAQEEPNISIFQGTVDIGKVPSSKLRVDISSINKNKPKASEAPASPSSTTDPTKGWWESGNDQYEDEFTEYEGLVAAPEGAVAYFSVEVQCREGTHIDDLNRLVELMKVVLDSDTVARLTEGVFFACNVTRVTSVEKCIRLVFYSKWNGFTWLSDQLKEMVSTGIQKVECSIDAVATPRDMYLNSKKYLDYRNRLKEDGYLTPWAKEILQLIFKRFDSDNDNALNQVEMQRLLEALKNDGSHIAFKNSAEFIDILEEGNWATDDTGNLSYPAFEGAYAAVQCNDLGSDMKALGIGGAGDSLSMRIRWQIEMLNDIFRAFDRLWTNGRWSDGFVKYGTHFLSFFKKANMRFKFLSFYDLFKHNSCPVQLRTPGLFALLVLDFRAALGREYWRAQEAAEKQGEEEQAARALVEEAEMIAAELIVEVFDDKKNKKKDRKHGATSPSEGKPVEDLLNKPQPPPQADSSSVPEEPKIPNDRRTYAELTRALPRLGSLLSVEVGDASIAIRGDVKGCDLSFIWGERM